MNNKTENYIILKPIAERFNKVASEISDDDIKSIIKMAMKEQIENSFDFGVLSDIAEEYIDDNKDKINEMIMESICNKLCLK